MRALPLGVIAEHLNLGTDPLALYAGNKRNGYIVERLSFRAGGAGQVRAADDNPYTLYSRLVGLASAGGTTTGAGNAMANELLESRKSVNDLVRAELNALKLRPELSADDRARLDQHFQAIRDAEVTMGGMADAMACSTGGLEISQLDALKSGLAFRDRCNTRCISRSRNAAAGPRSLERRPERGFQHRC